MKKKNLEKEKALPIAVSPAAHNKMRNDAFNSKPRRTLRQHLNIINNLPKDL